MRIVGIGCDLLSVSRLRSLVARRGALRLAQRICSPGGEIDGFDKCTDELRYLALRWTAKEAAYKALHGHTRIRSWHDLVVDKSDGKPRIRLVKDGPRLHLTVSHDADLMIAFVVAEEG